MSKYAHKYVLSSQIESTGLTIKSFIFRINFLHLPVNDLHYLVTLQSCVRIAISKYKEFVAFNKVSVCLFWRKKSIVFDKFWFGFFSFISKGFFLLAVRNWKQNANWIESNKSITTNHDWQNKLRSNAFGTVIARTKVSTSGR